MNLFLKKLATVLSVTVILLTNTGCDQVRDKISSWINPKTPQQVLDSVNQKIADRKFKEALDEIEVASRSGLQKIDDAIQGKLDVLAAESSFQVGDLEKGYEYLVKALKSNAITSKEAMNEPLFEPVKTQIRFVQVLVQTYPTQQVVNKSSTVNPGVAQESSKSIEANSGDTSVKLNPNGGIEAKAGNVSVKLP